VVCDAASCTEGIERSAPATSGSPATESSRCAVEFVDERIGHAAQKSPRRSDAFALHPTLLLGWLGTNDALSRIAGAICRRGRRAR
jgi:hypothetical protein